MNYKKEVDIISWEHTIESKIHEDVVNYVKGLEQNHFVALEVIPEMLFEVNLYLDQLKGVDIEKKYQSKEQRNFIENYKKSFVNGVPKFLFNKMFSAIFEIVLNARIRGVIFVPIENRKLAFEHLKDFYVTIPGKFEYDNAKREEHFLDSIVELATRTKGSISVIAGLAHALSIQHKFKNSGIDANIRTDIFRNSEMVSAHMKFMKDIRAVIKKRDSFEKGSRDWYIYEDIISGMEKKQAHIDNSNNNSFDVADKRLSEMLRYYSKKQIFSLTNSSFSKPYRIKSKKNYPIVPVKRK